ncbi:DUF397 domain-containing protein [Kitasatospora acidiphila]|uniref:DUF397 domain-containing protein n=1 Tax=Kitasatospora acidiphila TaxID=2567942 RepID=A0A540WA08_9ACTN|nr:DUF397 domain-containing protein [Kitasatospora acidiphila]TQF05859.1 DUF397 domain-containing protein [Kitasatospora acidiphila]
MTAHHVTDDTALNVVTWHVSTYSGSGQNCVEHGRRLDGIELVRDTKARDQGTLAFPTGSWSAFIEAVKQGAFPALSTAS